MFSMQNSFYNHLHCLKGQKHDCVSLNDVKCEWERAMHKSILLTILHYCLNIYTVTTFIIEGIKMNALRGSLHENQCVLFFQGDSS